MDKPAPHCSA
jgi:D-alanyl-D-alanine carboxypeptidase (penicillin-binding protein 5/6)